jgi:hypothetical protein
MTLQVGMNVGISKGRHGIRPARTQGSQADKAGFLVRLLALVRRQQSTHPSRGQQSKLTQPSQPKITQAPLRSAPTPLHNDLALLRERRKVAQIFRQNLIQPRFSRSSQVPLSPIAVNQR